MPGGLVVFPFPTHKRVETVENKVTDLTTLCICTCIMMWCLEILWILGLYIHYARLLFMQMTGSRWSLKPTEKKRINKKTIRLFFLPSPYIFSVLAVAKPFVSLYFSLCLVGAVESFVATIFVSRTVLHIFQEKKRPPSEENRVVLDWQHHLKWCPKIRIEGNQLLLWRGFWWTLCIVNLATSQKSSCDHRPQQLICRK